MIERGYLESSEADTLLFTNQITLHLLVGQFWWHASYVMSLFIPPCLADHFDPVVLMRTGTSCHLSWQPHAVDEEVMSAITVKQLHTDFASSPTEQTTQPFFFSQNFCLKVDWMQLFMYYERWLWTSALGSIMWFGHMDVKDLEAVVQGDSRLIEAKKVYFADEWKSHCRDF